MNQWITCCINNRRRLCQSESEINEKRISVQYTKTIHNLIWKLSKEASDDTMELNRVTEVYSRSMELKHMRLGRSWLGFVCRLLLLRGYLKPWTGTASKYRVANLSIIPLLMKKFICLNIFGREGFRNITDKLSHIGFIRKL